MQFFSRTKNPSIDNPDLTNEFKSEGPAKELIKMPEIYIEPRALQKLFLFAEMHHEELSGIGSVDIVEEVRSMKEKISQITIKEIFAVESFNTTAHTDATDGLATYFLGLVEKGKSTEHLKVWFHSHHSMGPFWSWEDHDTAYNFDNEDFMISIVIGTNQQLRARIDIYNPLRITIDNVPIKLKSPITEDKTIRKEVRKEINKFVKNDNRLGLGHRVKGVLL